MKKLILLTIVAAGVIACNNTDTPDTTGTDSMADLTAWLDSIDNLGDLTAEQMTAIQGEWDAATEGMEADMDETAKSEWADLQERWNAIKGNSVDADANEDGASTDSTDSTATDATDAEAGTVSPEHMKEIATEFFGDVEMSDANDFSFMTADNALSVYQGFAAKAKAHKADYNVADWNFVKNLYETMDAKKNDIEKDLKGTDNLKIAKIKAGLAVMFKVGKTKEQIKNAVD